MDDVYISPDKIWTDFVSSDGGHHDPNQYIRELKERFPCCSSWFKRETWTSNEAVLVFHNIDPFILEGDDIIEKHREQVVGIIDAEMDMSGNLRNYLRVSDGSKSEVSIGEFIDFLRRKDYPIPDHFSLWFKTTGHESSGISVLGERVEAVQDNIASTPTIRNTTNIHQIDFNSLSFPVLASFGANIIVQIYRRNLKKKGGRSAIEADRISYILKNNKDLNSFLEDCAQAEGKKKRKNDTIREYLEPQFKKVGISP